MPDEKRIDNTASDMLDRIVKQLRKELTEYVDVNRSLFIDNIVNYTELPNNVVEYVSRTKSEIQQIQNLSDKLRQTP